MNSPGTLGIAHQSAMTYGERSWARRLVVTDLEVNLGWRSNVELDIDWAISRDSGGQSGQWASDPLWASVKIGLFDQRFQGGSPAIAGGLQLGPRLPIWKSGQGVGYAALGLVGLTVDASTLVINAGYAIDPGATVSTQRPSAFLVGLDLTRRLDREQHFALLGEIGSVLYTSRDPNEFDLSLGLGWDPTDHLEFSLVALGGQLANRDRFAILFGVSPTIELF